MREKLPLMSTNAGSKKLKRGGAWLIVGSCVIQEHTDILEEIGKNFDNLVHICLEETHINMAEAKLAAMVKISMPAKIAAITVDGSPHCVQLHYLIEDIRKYYNLSVETSHFVIYNNKLFEVSSDAVKTSRYLNKIQKLLNATKNSK
ncbi:MAG: 4Fe-4S ferredoxin [Candidatus Odinarchaeota archaeon]|nr:4Fe-4S ferredoxin [Candidatus Odinarchaeota archaeon]